jgi:hypothetical protein
MNILGNLKWPQVQELIHQQDMAGGGGILQGLLVPVLTVFLRVCCFEPIPPLGKHPSVPARSKSKLLWQTWGLLTPSSGSLGHRQADTIPGHHHPVNRQSCQFFQLVPVHPRKLLGSGAATSKGSSFIEIYLNRDAALADFLGFLSFLIRLGFELGQHEVGKVAKWLLYQLKVHFTLVTFRGGGSHERFAHAGLKPRSSQSQPPK